MPRVRYLRPAILICSHRHAKSRYRLHPADTELTASSDAFTTFYASCGLPILTGNDANVPSKWLTPDFRLKLFDAQAKAAEPKNFATVTQKKLGSGFAINGRWTDPTAKLVAANLLVCSKSLRWS